MLTNARVIVLIFPVSLPHLPAMSFTERQTEESSVDAPSSTLFVGHLPYNMTESEVMALFPGSTSARIMSDPFTGLSKGYAHALLLKIYILGKIY